VKETVMTSADEINPAARLGLDVGLAVKEIGRDADIDEELREGIEEVTGHDLLDEDDDATADLVLLWFREGDGDLDDALAHAAELLAAGGDVWLLTPVAGRDGFVEPEDIADAAQAVGLTPTDSVGAGDDWNASRLSAPGEAKAGWTATGAETAADQTGDADDADDIDPVGKPGGGIDDGIEGLGDDDR
jgi:hypothetical protein